jgi:hypothetical protein
MAITKEEATIIAQSCLYKNPRLTYKIDNLQQLDAWIAVNKRVNEEAWPANCKT